MSSKLKLVQQRVADFSKKSTHQFTAAKDKKNNYTFSVKDGFIRYKVTIYSSIKCQCEKELCDHSLFILLKEFAMSEKTICFLELEDVTKKFVGLLENGETKNLNKELENEIDTYFSSNDCGICAGKLNDAKHKMNLFECSTCHKYIHNTCMSNWLNFGKTKEGHVRKCIYCVQKV